MADDPLKSEPYKQNPQEMAQQMATAWSAMAACASEIAAAKRSIYLAYINEGFTANEALELIKQV